MISAVRNPWVLVLAAFAAIIALLLAVRFIPPSHADLRRIALELVPPGTQVTDVGENTGSELISGQYHVTAMFVALDVASDDLYANSRTHAEAEGWRIVETQIGPGGWDTQLERLGLSGRLFVNKIRPRGDAMVLEDRELTGRVIGGAFLGAPLMVLLGAAVITRARAGRRQHAAGE